MVMIVLFLGILVKTPIASCLDPMMRMEQPNKWESSLMGRAAHLETAGDTPSKVP